MSEQIDWSKAPEWATKHGLIGMGRQPIWFNKSEYTYVNGQQGGRVFLFDGPGYPIAGVIDATERQTTTSWSGEGLPQVGVDIEVLHELYGWIGARVVGQDGEAAIVRTNDGYSGVFRHQMRPIRTPELIAADEREAAIKEMTASYAKNSDMLAGWAAYVYDTLGYRKP